MNKLLLIIRLTVPLLLECVCMRACIYIYMYVCIYTYVSIPLDDSRIDTRASPAERDGERKKGRVKWCETASERVERECA